MLGFLWAHEDAHHPPAAVIVQVHQRPRVFDLLLLGVHEGLGELDAVVDVVAAAAPVKVAPVVAGPAPLVGVAVARLELPLAAGSGNGIDHSG